ncbi:class I SAM-dependent methyltransferase [Alkaliphilus peptidifermentans]|uniref:Ubiquinone/menaquinone biosynthesis C-methylase UbiE n=1 Tax=Alkaliphilus peptidifermentans DSM 18978 TaxID=1120976 RepID=A0A1G5EJ79_9FIRM|nr:class I SAM-dependent methyltransferase [Alkaliphilus peptidifermentans]SCY26841.1 Ubiquinone/menaquinone biosynthesis C-methylase UbiE [Alkaliphilus peptidifermentans DSM 18978]
MYKITTADKFLWEGISLDGKLVLEGGTSWGNTTDLIAEKISANGWKTRLISVDVDESHFAEVEERLRDKFHELILRKADLSNLDFISQNSVDVIICNYTLSSVNQFPFRAIKALKEFYRILKPGGKLLITEEMPIWAVESRDYEYWSKRLRIIKSISVLKAMAHFNEIHPQDLEEVMSTLGFKDILRQEFKEIIDAEMATKFLDKRKQTLIKGQDDLQNEHLTKGFVELTEKLVEAFENAKEFSAPAYIIKADK